MEAGTIDCMDMDRPLTRDEMARYVAALNRCHVCEGKGVVR